MLFTSIMPSSYSFSYTRGSIRYLFILENAAFDNTLMSTVNVWIIIYYCVLHDPFDTQSM